MTEPSARQPAGSGNTLSTPPFPFDPKIWRHAAAAGHLSSVSARFAKEANSPKV